MRFAERVEEGALLRRSARARRVRRAVAGSQRRSSGCRPRSCRIGLRDAGAPARTRASRRMRRGIVSPSTRSITKPRPRCASVGSCTRTLGTGSPAARAASSRAASTARSPWPPRPGGSRRSTKPWRAPSGATRSNDQLSRDAPPDNRCKCSTRPAPRSGSSTDARMSPSSAAIAAEATPRRCNQRRGAFRAEWPPSTI